METLKKEKNRSQSQTITLNIKSSIFQDNVYIEKRIFKAFDRIKPGSHSRAIALDLRSSVFQDTRIQSFLRNSRTWHSNDKK